MNRYCKFIVISRKEIIKPINTGAVFCNIPLDEEIIRIGLYDNKESIMEDFLKLKNLLSITDKPIHKSLFFSEGKDNRRYCIKRENRQVTTEEGYNRFLNICDFKSVDEFLKSNRNKLI